MDNYYSLLGLNKNASSGEIKRAFREKAKQLHPDIAGKTAEAQMRSLLAAYRALSCPDTRFAYDRAFARFSKVFDYPAFLKERKQDPVSQAKLIFYLLLRDTCYRSTPATQNDSFSSDKENEYNPLSVWTENGGLDFLLEKHLDREDWMDCGFLLAEELEKHNRVFEAFCLLFKITKEEKRKPYFKHFMQDIELFIHKISKRLKENTDKEQYEECMEALLSLGIKPKKDRVKKRRKARVL